MAYRIATYQTNDGAVPDSEEWVAVIRVQKHVATFTFAATEEEALEKARAHMALQASKKTAGGRKATKPTPQPEEIEEAI